MSSCGLVPYFPDY